MARTKIVIASVLIFASVLVIAYLGMRPGGITGLNPDNTVTDEMVESVRESLESGEKIELAFPSKTIYRRGESFEVRLGISNMLSTGENFRISIVQESGPEDGPVINAIGETGLLPPGESVITGIFISTTPLTPGGIYGYSVIVCSGEPCTAESDSVYATTRMNFRIYG
jgi:hypothetical protein